MWWRLCGGGGRAEGGGVRDEGGGGCALHAGGSEWYAMCAGVHALHAVPYALPYAVLYSGCYGGRAPFARRVALRDVSARSCVPRAGGREGRSAVSAVM